MLYTSNGVSQIQRLSSEKQKKFLCLFTTTRLQKPTGYRSQLSLKETWKRFPLPSMHRLIMAADKSHLQSFSSPLRYVFRALCFPLSCPLCISIFADLCTASQISPPLCNPPADRSSQHILREWQLELRSRVINMIYKQIRRTEQGRGPRIEVPPFLHQARQQMAKVTTYAASGVGSTAGSRADTSSHGEQQSQEQQGNTARPKPSARFHQRSWESTDLLRPMAAP